MGSKVFALEPVLGTPEEPGQLISGFQEAVSGDLVKIQSSGSFGLFIMNTELEKFNLSLVSLFETVVARSDMKPAKKLFESKLELQTASELAELQMISGIAFGSLYPEFTEQIYQLPPDDATKERAISFGVEISDEYMSLEDLEYSLLTLTAIYVNEFFPAQIARLGLEQYFTAPAAA